MEYNPETGKFSGLGVNTGISASANKEKSSASASKKKVPLPQAKKKVPLPQASHKNGALVIIQAEEIPLKELTRPYLGPVAPRIKPKCH